MVSPLKLRPEYIEDSSEPVEGGGYVVRGQEFPRVTSVLNVLNKDGLPYWMRARVLRRIGEVLRDPDTQAELRSILDPVNPMEKGEQDYNAWLERTLVDCKGAPDRQKDAAAERGTNIHEELADYFRALPEKPPLDALSPEARAGVAFVQQKHLTVEALEVKLWSPAHRYAGTCDAVGRTYDGKRIIWDWKTGSGPWWEMALQLGGYWGMLNELTLETPKDAYVVKLRGESYECYRVQNLPLAYQSFLSALQLSGVKYSNWWEKMP